MEYRYARWDSDRLAALAQDGLLKLFHYLLLLTSGDVEEALRWLEEMKARGRLPADWDLEKFKQKLEDERYIKKDPKGGFAPAARAEKLIREQALERIFGGLRPGGRGTHATPYSGEGTFEALPERRPFQFGDDLDRIDFQESLKKSLRRGDDLELGEEDLTVTETEAGTSCATVLLLDVSHSMVLYGEDRITPAKQVALALVELILRRYPKDSLRVVLFGDSAVEVKISDLTYVSAGPFHTNTKAGLQLARSILAREKHPNRQIIMITDGKPSVIDRPGGQVYRNPVGLDPVIVNRTLDEAVVCRKRRIPITTFMIASDPYLRQFVAKLTELNKGRAYFTAPDELGRFVIWDFVTQRRRKIR